jgi:hypothetical protein
MDDKAETSLRVWIQSHLGTGNPAGTELLAVTIYDEKSSADAFRRLSFLSQSGPEEIKERARRAVKEAIGYHKYKSVRL